MKLNQIYEYEVYLKVSESALIKSMLNTIEKCREKMHDMPEYGELTEKQVESDIYYSRYIHDIKMEITKLIKQIRKEVKNQYK